MRALWSEKAKPKLKPKSESQSDHSSCRKGPERAALAPSGLMRTSPPRRVCQPWPSPPRSGAEPRAETSLVSGVDGLVSGGHLRTGVIPSESFFCLTKGGESNAAAFRPAIENLLANGSTQRFIAGR